MTEDLSHVPRRLRRFYRHNMPVPEELAHIGEPKTKNPPALMPTPGDEEAPHEPWMDATPGKGFSNPADEKPLSRREQRRMQSNSSEDASGKPGLFGRILHAGNPAPKPVDHALGLQQAKQFEDKLPQSGEKILDALAKKNESDTRAANADVANTLNELKRLAGNQKDSPPTLTSFHFTPVAGAPNPVDTKPAAPSSGLNNETLTPRQRAEMRRMRTGTSGFGAGSEDEKPAAAPLASSAPVPAHIRRRAGRVVGAGEEQLEAADAKDAGPSPFEDEEDKDSMRDLLDENEDAPKKKKLAKKAADEDDDLDLGDDLEDLAPLDDEK